MAIVLNFQDGCPKKMPDSLQMLPMFRGQRLWGRGGVCHKGWGIAGWYFWGYIFIWVFGNGYQSGSFGVGVLQPIVGSRVSNVFWQPAARNNTQQQASKKIFV